MKLKAASEMAVLNMGSMSATIIAQNSVSLQLNGFSVLITYNMFVIIANLLHRNSHWALMFKVQPELHRFETKIQNFMISVM